HARLVVGIDHVAGDKLSTKNFVVLLHDSDHKVLRLAGPVGVAYPNLIFAGARHFDVLPEAAAGLVRAGGYRVPLALAALRPFGRYAGAADAPARRFGSRQIEIGRIQLWLVLRCFSQAAHVLGV